MQELPAIPEPPRRQLPKFKFKIQRKHVIIAVGLIVLGGAIVFGFPAYQRWQDARAWKVACERAQSVGEDCEKAAESFRAYTIANSHGHHLEEAENKIQVGLEEGDWKRTRAQIATGETLEQINAVSEVFRSNYPSSRFNAESKKLIEGRLNQLAEQEWQATQGKVSEAEVGGNLTEAIRLVDVYISTQKSTTWKSKARVFKQEIIDHHYDALMAEGKRNEENKNWESALAAYRSAGEIKPKESAPREGIARVHEAIARLKAAEHQEQFEAAMQEGKQAEARKDKAGALAAYKNAVQDMPDSPEAKQAVARLEAEKRHDWFESVMKEATQAEAKGDRTGALADYNEAVQILPDSTEAKQGKARLEAVAKFMMEGARAEARKDWDNALVAYQNAWQRIPDAGDIKEAVERVKEKVIATRQQKALEDQRSQAEAERKAREAGSPPIISFPNPFPKKFPWP